MQVYADVLRYRELFWDLFRRDLRVRYRGSAIGLAWTLVNPLVLMGVYTLLFSVLMRIPGVGSIDNFPLFVLTGLVAWVFFQASIQTATTTIVGNSALVKQVRFPRQLLPLSVVATNLVTLAVMLAVVLSFALWLLPETRTTFWAAIPLLIPLVGLASGLGLLVACANALFRDVEHLVGAALLPLFLLTPIFYSFEQLPGLDDKERLVNVMYYGNFMVPMVEALRDPLFFGDLPDAGDVIYCVVAAAVALALGALVFNRVDDRLVAEL
ncbi:MAG: ABC transporter permease [Actinomycetota bacterium]|nr:ABC transporter permease [Actinomycetota bacterium]